MRFTLLFSLFLMILVAVFSVQNAGMITVRFLGWSFVWSQALVILLAAFAGALVGLMVGAFTGRRKVAQPETPPPKA
jgi:uncharacterized integral membrane protein